MKNIDESFFYCFTSFPIKTSVIVIKYDNTTSNSRFPFWRIAFRNIAFKFMI